MGCRDHQGRRELPDLRRDRAARGDPLARPPEGGGRRRQRRARPAVQAQRHPDRESRQGDRRGPARRPVPDRRLPDRLGNLDEHERQRGDRQARRRGCAPQRPRQHGPVLQRRVPLGGAPRRARCRAERAAPRPAPARALLRAQGQSVPERRQVRAHASDGCRPRHTGPGVRRLRRSDRARPGAGAVGARARRADPAGRHRDRNRAEHAPPLCREGSRAPEAGIRAAARSPRRATRSRPRPTATRSSSSRVRSRSSRCRSPRSPATSR